MSGGQGTTERQEERKKERKKRTKKERHRRDLAGAIELSPGEVEPPGGGGVASFILHA